MEFSLLQDCKDLFNNHYNEMEDTEKWLPPGLRYFQHLIFLPQTPNKILVNPYVFFLSFLLYEGEKRI